MTTTLGKNMRSGLEAKISENTDDFVHGLDLTWRKVQRELEKSRPERHRE
jgi:hypothetical protein